MKQRKTGLIKADRVDPIAVPISGQRSPARSARRTKGELMIRRSGGKVIAEQERRIAGPVKPDRVQAVSVPIASDRNVIGADRSEGEVDVGGAAGEGVL